MARAFVTQELCGSVKRETALLGLITSTLALEGIYILHLCAYSAGGKGYIHMITRDNRRAQKALAHFIPEMEERDVLVVEFENKVGTLAPVAKILGNHNIFIDYVYGTSADGFKIVGIFSTDDNVRASEVINRESGALGLS